MDVTRLSLEAVSLNEEKITFDSKDRGMMLGEIIDMFNNPKLNIWYSGCLGKLYLLFFTRVGD